MTKEGKGSLFFSKQQPEVSGYLMIDGEGFEIVGWRASPIRADIQIRSNTGCAEGGSDGYDGSGSGARKCDTAGS